ncbi:MAG TPA: redoxin family protein [Kofleriaceae bacterium]|nr:redoxin family protein [Kofleriaceae bacterium]
MADDPSKKDGASYYYELRGVEHGPVDRPRLIQLAETRVIRTSTRVWTDAMPVKVSASKVQFLAAHLTRGASPAAGLAAGAVAGLVGIGVLAAFLWMVPAAAAREGESACRGLAGFERPNPALCPDGQDCKLPILAPDFTARDRNGKPVKLSDFRGKVVLLNFWASWCGTCKSEKPGLGEMSEALSGRDFEVIALASDSEWRKVLPALVTGLKPDARLPQVGEDGYTFEQAKALYGRELPNGAPFQVFLDPPKGDDTIGVIARSWGIEKVPESALIDRQGKIRAYFVNKRDWSSPVAQTCIRSVIDE